MKVYEFINIIEETAPLEASASWDVSGVQVAAQREEIARVAVMLDPSLEGIARALEDGADFILCHHPLSLQPRFPNVQDSYLDILSLLFRHDAWLYSAHTSLDANPEGPVQWLGQALGLMDRFILEPNDPADPYGYGFGFAGTLPMAMAYTDFCRFLGRITGKGRYQACGLTPDSVRRVACCPGSGSGLLEAARGAEADVFITGDVRFHTALDCAGLLPRVLDVGHFCLEEEMMRRFALELDESHGVSVYFYPGVEPLQPEDFFYSAE